MNRISHDHSFICKFVIDYFVVQLEIWRERGVDDFVFLFELTPDSSIWKNLDYNAFGDWKIICTMVTGKYSNHDDCSSGCHGSEYFYFSSKVFFLLQSDILQLFFQQLPPVRNTLDQKKLRKKKKRTTERVQNKPKRISSYDYLSWDTFDVVSWFFNVLFTHSLLYINSGECKTSIT